jgi:Zn-dependent M16 (insulinase) family peptidase
MARRIDTYTGGVGLAANARTRYDVSGGCLPFISFNSKCLVRNLDKMFDIIDELIFSFDFSDPDRLKKLLLEYRAGFESSIVQNGHRLAIALSSRNHSPAGALSESWHGIHQLLKLKEISADLSEERLQSLADRLTRIGTQLFSRRNLKMALIGEDEAVSSAASNTESLWNRLSEESAGSFAAPEIEVMNAVPREGWTISTAVSFVARTFKAVRMEHEDAAALAVIAKMLRSLYLHREVREKGGAYGGFANYNAETGIFSFGSYRDPHVVSTLNVYEGAAGFINSNVYSDVDIKEAVLQVCSDIDRPDPPGPAARKAFYRKIISLSDEARLRFKKRLLAMTRDQVKSAARKYFDPDQRKADAVAVISSEEKLKRANAKISGGPLTLLKI